MVRVHADGEHFDGRTDGKNTGYSQQMSVPLRDFVNAILSLCAHHSTPIYIVTENQGCFCGTMPERRQRWPTISGKQHTAVKIQHNPCNSQNHWINLSSLTENAQKKTS
jgi:hypothetical protein